MLSSCPIRIAIRPFATMTQQVSIFFQVVCSVTVSITDTYTLITSSHFIRDIGKGSYMHKYHYIHRRNKSKTVERTNTIGYDVHLIRFQPK